MIVWLPDFDLIVPKAAYQPEFPSAKTDLEGHDILAVEITPD